MNVDMIRGRLERVRDAIMWSPRRAFAVFVAAAVMVVAATAVSVSYAGRRHFTAAATVDASTGCARAADVWADVFTDSTLDDDSWRRAVTDLSTGKAAAWLPTLDRSNIPTGGHTVTPATASETGCVVWVDFTDGHRWYLALVPGTDGVWRVDEWDDGA